MNHIIIHPLNGLQTHVPMRIVSMVFLPYLSPVFLPACLPCLPPPSLTTTKVLGGCTFHIAGSALSLGNVFPVGFDVSLSQPQHPKPN
jgi:hypothetical protein